jgi:hypothetical protein
MEHIRGHLWHGYISQRIAMVVTVKLKKKRKKTPNKQKTTKKNVNNPGFAESCVLLLVAIKNYQSVDQPRCNILPT